MITLNDGTQIEIVDFNEAYIVFNKNINDIYELENKLNTKNLSRFEVDANNTKCIFTNFVVTGMTMDTNMIYVNITKVSNIDLKIQALEDENLELRECIKELTKTLFE